jgi:UDP-N-acetyl-D-galactosamine dehydrogenase
VVDIVDELQEFGCKLDIYDPWADQAEVEHEYGIKTMAKNIDIYAKKYDAVILAVSHEQFAQLDFKRLTNGENSVIFDIKGYLPKDMVDGRL